MEKVRISKRILGLFGVKVTLNPRDINIKLFVVNVIEDFVPDIKIGSSQGNFASSVVDIDINLGVTDYLDRGETLLTTTKIA